MRSKTITASALTLTWLTGAVHAHDLTGHGGIQGGLMHPLLGLDHLLVCLAIGIWAGRQSGPSGRAIPGVFLAAVAAGAAAALVGMTLPAPDPVLAATVLIAGLLVASLGSPARVTAVVAVTLIGLFHGNAHMIAAFTTTGLPGYLAAMLLTSALLVGTGMAAGRLLATRPGHSTWFRISGAAIATAGGFFLAGSV
ncbi:MAG: HupE/UreJ family protein [Pseudomonadota bacterium]|nr:HupE/UreJ family protein [Pseudomonadota bacterium]